MHWVLRHISSTCGRWRRRAAVAALLAIAVVVAPQVATTATAGAQDLNLSQPASFPECIFPPPGQNGPPYSLSDAAPCAYLSYLINPQVLAPGGLVDDGMYQATSAEQTALSDLQAQAVANTLSDHDLPASDADAVRTWGQADAEAELWALIVQAIETPAASRTSDQQGAVDWLASVDQAVQVLAARDAIDQYADWAGISPDDLSAPPEPDPGYCTYTSPDGSYTPSTALGDDPECAGVPCPNILGCNPPTPTADQFVQWGQDEENSDLKGLFSSPNYAQALTAIQTAETFGGAVAGAAVTGAAISASMGSLFAGTALQEAIFPFAGLVNYVTSGVAAGTVTAADAAAAAEAVAGGLTASGVGVIIAAIIFAVTTATLEGMNVFDAANLPSDLEGDLSSAESTTPDLPSLLGSTSGAQSLFALFVGATMPSETLYICSGSETPGNAEGAIAGLLGLSADTVGASTSAPAGACNTPAIPAQSAGDPVFCVQEKGSLSLGSPLEEPKGNTLASVSPSTEPCAGQSTSDVPASYSGPGASLASSVSWTDGTAPDTSTDSAWLTGNWFVETATPAGGSPVTVQTLDIHYVDWSGTEQTAWLIDTPEGYEFVGVPDQTSSSPSFDPSTCVADGSCWASSSIEYVGPDGNDYTAWVEATTSTTTGGTPGPATPPAGLALGTTVTSLSEQVTLTATASADPVEGAPESFSASGSTQYGLPLSYSWQFEQPAAPGSVQVCGTFDPTTGGFSPGPCWSPTVDGAQVNYTWPATGTYEVQVTATDAYGNSATDTFSVSIGDVPPVLSVSSACPGALCSDAQPARLSGTLTHAGADDAETVTVNWGDGTTSSYGNANGGLQAASATVLDLSASHSYTSPGLYKVTVAASDQSGASAYATVYELGPGTTSVAQALSFLPAPNQAPYGVGALPVTAFGGLSGEPVTLSSLTPSACAVSSPVGSAAFGAEAWATAQVRFLSAGTCTIAANQAGTGGEFSLVNPPFTAAPQATQSFMVTPAKLLVNADNEEMTYGGTVPASGVTYQGFVNGDGPSSVSGLSCQATTPAGKAVTSATPAGNYTITCSGASAPGYTISYGPGQLQVRPAPLTVSADDETMPHGGPLPALGVSYQGFVASDTAASLTYQPTCHTPANTRSGVGTYPIDCMGAFDPNYRPINYIPGKLTVVPAPLTVTASSAEMAQGGKVPAISASYAGWKDGNTASALSALPLCSTTATSSSSPGTYPSNCTGAAAHNYSISYVRGTITVLTAGQGTSPGTTTATTGGSGSSGESGSPGSSGNSAGGTSGSSGTTPGTTIPEATGPTVPIPGASATTNPGSTTTTTTPTTTSTTASSSSPGGSTSTRGGSSSRGSSSGGGAGLGGSTANLPQVLRLSPASGPKVAAPPWSSGASGSSTWRR